MNIANRKQGGQDAAAAIQSDGGAQRGQRARLINLLDRAIVLLMAAIVLTLAWPVGLAVWGQSHAAQAGAICLNGSSPSRAANVSAAPSGRT